MNGVALYYLRSSVLGGQVVSEINASGNWTRGYVYLGLQLVAVQQNNAVTWVHQDPVTKGQRLVANNGALVSTIELDPFGGDTDRSVNTSFQPRHFTTYERDTVGGMDEAMARRYHGWWSRFSQPDPYDGSYSLTDPQSFNRYSYVQSDPVNFVDPSGMCLAVQFMDPATERTWWEFYLCNDNTTRDGGGGGGGEGGGGGGGVRGTTRTVDPDETKPRDIYEECKGKIPAGVPVPSREEARAIAQAARDERMHPMYLAVTASTESRPSFNLYPINGPHGRGTADIGPGQLDYGGLQNWSGLTGLTNVFGTNLGVGQQFNGDPVSNLRAAARLINDMGGGQTGTIHYHSGRGTFLRTHAGQQALRDRTRQYKKRAPAYKAFFDCLASDPFGFY